MAEPVLVPVSLEVTDLSMDSVDVKDLNKTMDEKLSGVKQHISDIFSSVDMTKMNKAISSSMKRVENDMSGATVELRKFEQAMIRSGKSSDGYKRQLSAIAEEQAKLATLESEMNAFKGFDPKNGIDVNPESLQQYNQAVERYQAQMAKVIQMQDELNPADYALAGASEQVAKLEESYEKLIKLMAQLNEDETKFNQTAQDNKLSDEYSEALKQAEEYKKKLEALNEKSKKMESLGATDKAWETVNYETKQVSSELNSILSKMREMVKTGAAFRFGDGDKKELNSQIKSFSMTGRNIGNAVAGRVQSNENPFTAEYSAALDELSKLEAKLESINEKSAKMEALGTGTARQWAEMKYDAEQLRSQIEATVESMQGMVSDGTAFKFETGSEDEELTRLDEVLNNVSNSMEVITERSYDKASSFEGEAKAADEDTEASGRLKTALSAVGRAIGNVFSGIGNTLLNVGKGIGSAIKNLNKLRKSGKSTSSSMDKGFKKLSKTVLNLGFGFRSAYFLIRYLRNAFKEAFKVMASQFDEINQQVSKFVMSFNRLKGTIGTAFQPIVSVVLPYLTMFIERLGNAMESLGKFNAVLTGQGYIYKAVAQNVDYMAESAKNAKQALGAYDKLDVISKDNNDNENKLGVTYEKSEINKATSEFANLVKEAWKKVDFSDVGNYTGNKLLAVLANLRSVVLPKIREFLLNISTDVATFINGFTGIPALAGSLVSSVTDAVNTIVATLQNFMDRVDWAQIGAFIGEGFNMLITRIDLGAIGTLLGTQINTISTMIINGLAQIDWVAGGENLANGFNELLNNFDPALLAQSISGIITSILTLATTTIENIDWPLLVQKLGQFIAGIDWTGIVSGLAEGLGAIAGAITSVIWEILKGAWDSIVEWWYDIAYEDGQFTFSGLLEGLALGVRNIFSWIGEHIVQPIVNGFKKAFGIASPSKVMTEIGEYVMQGLKNGIESLKQKVVDIFEKLKDLIKKPINGIIGGIETLVNSVIKGLNTMIKAMNKLSFDVPDWVPAIGGKKFGFNIKEISTISIPRLAQGAVIPPNREFLAQLGDQRHGTNIEAPLDTIKQAVAEVLAEMRGGVKDPIVLQLDGRTVARVVWDEEAKRYKQTGKYTTVYAR